MPMIVRATMSTSGLWESAPSVDPAANTTSPACSAPLRPKRSPSAAAVNSRPAKIRPYASTIHCTWVLLAPSPPNSSGGFCSVGSATLSTVLPMMTISSDVHSTASVFHRRS